MTTLWSHSSRHFVIPSVVLGLLAVQAAAESPAGSDSARRGVFRDQRPDDSRGWFIVSKQSYWPLCYESLDRIEEAHKLVGSDDHQQTADAFDKSGAWLMLAASASMTDGNSGVDNAADAFRTAASSLREGSSDWSEAELRDLTTYGLLAMAKSHVLRAGAPDSEFKARRAPKPSANASAEVKAAASEAAREIADWTVAQYRYDAIETQRHLTAAQEYASAAARVGQFSINETDLAPIAEVETTKPGDLVEYVDVQLRPRIVSLRSFIDEKQKAISKKLVDRL